MRQIAFLIFFIFIYVNSAPVFSSETQDEINHLLEFVKNTECQYERNGELHTGKEAAKHIKKKYKYFKNEINSTEKFIELSATKSTMSGKYYMIHCKDNIKLKSQEWLLQELREYRRASTSVE